MERNRGSRLRSSSCLATQVWPSHSLFLTSSSMDIPTQPTMTATRRVYENDDLVRRILGFLTRSELRSIATLEKAFFPLVVDILWRAVDVWQVRSILKSVGYSAYYSFSRRLQDGF